MTSETTAARAASGALAVAVATVMAAPAQAQQAAGASSDRAVATLEEIVVTAQKREERLLDVPMSISAVTGDVLARQGATTLIGIASTVPGMSSIEFSPGQNRTQLRGVSSSTGSATIGLYLDEVPINVDSVQAGPDVRFIDLERVEVLRGPQGTLYGEGSMGGTVKYVTRAPDLRAASFGFDSALGTVVDGAETYRAHVVANLPLVADTFALRFAGGFEKSPGWVDYPAIGGKDVNDGQSTTARLRALWKPSDSLSISAMVLYQNTEFDSQAFADANRQAPYVLLQPSNDEQRLANVVVQYDAASVSLLSSTSYLKRDNFTQFDVTGFFAPLYLLFGVPPGVVRTVALPGDAHYEIFSQELRLASRGEGPMRWTAGLYYRDYDESGRAESITTPNPLPFALFTNESTRTSKQSAAFGELTYAFSPQWEATLGLRYFRDERTKAGQSANFGFPTPEPADEAEFTSTNPRFVLSYRPGDGLLVYASAAKGFRSGGFNLVGARPPGCELPNEFDPEDLWTYEIGSNASLAQGRFVVQAALYRNEWENIQSSVFCPGGTITQTTNAGKASGTGIDLAMTLRPSDPLTLTLAAGYNDTEYDTSGAAQAKGDRIDYVPRFAGSAAADYDFQWTAALPGRLRLDYQYTGDYTIALRNFAGGPPLAESDSYGRLNARLSVFSGEWEFSVYGQNLTDTNKVVLPQTGVLLVPLSMQPRTYGVGVRYNY